jgi:hypothetical protein
MLTSSEKTCIVAVILRRFVDGNFFEQFSDQLDLALKLNPDFTLEAARKGLTSTKAFIRRKSVWLLLRQERIEKSKTERNE